MALELLPIVKATTWKVLELRPPPIDMESGTVNRGLLLPIAMLMPPAGAGPFRPTVHVEVPRLPNALGLHDSEVTEGSAPPVTVPPVCEIAMPVPAGDDPRELVIPIAVLVTPTAIVKFTTATGPFVIIAEFIPETTQLYVPVPPAQNSVLPAELAELPAAAEIAATLPTGYVTEN